MASPWATPGARPHLQDLTSPRSSPAAAASPAQEEAAEVEEDEEEEEEEEEEAEQEPPPRRLWRKNERLVYAANFAHMTMYTMCLGGVFDLFLYSVSQEQTVLVPDSPLSIGTNVVPPLPSSVDTREAFELTFQIRPMRNMSFYPPGSDCEQRYTCGTSVLHVTDGSGEGPMRGDCCLVGNRIPLLMLDNHSTRMHVAMDALGQEATMSVKEYDRLQKCSTQDELPLEQWSHVKLKVCDAYKSKGQMKPGDHDEGGMLMLFINGTIKCGVAGTKCHQLPSRKGAQVFFGSLQAPLTDLHLPANVELRDVVYGRPASNLFVGAVNSLQGLIAMLLMYPLGWLGDNANRYQLLRWNMAVGAVAAALLCTAVTTRNIIYLYGGVVIFTFYQQCISSIIYAVLADNVERHRRTSAGVNYKTLSALAMSLGPGLQLLVIASGSTDDAWTPQTLELLLLPGWVVLPLIALAIMALRPVGKQISQIPSVDEVRERADGAISRLGPDQAWLDERVLFSWKRRFVVAGAANLFFILTLFANGMTVRYFSLYFTQILRFSPAQFCALNAGCRLWIAVFAQVGKPLARALGRSNMCVVMHLGSALFTLGIYGAGFFQPSTAVACASYLMRFAFLHARDPVLYSMTMDCAPANQRSRWAALNSLRSLSFSVSALLGGYLADRHGYQFSFNLTVVLLVASTLFFLPAWWCFPRSEGHARETRHGGRGRGAAGGAEGNGRETSLLEAEVGVSASTALAPACCAVDAGDCESFAVAEASTADGASGKSGGDLESSTTDVPR